jgi:hypothetical protein
MASSSDSEKNSKKIVMFVPGSARRIVTSSCET